ncbi:MAG: sodium/proton-translocating pyrophosphatase, partial [Firmicutes bacterium]|nr:sodium/proton-translocating pyrophosphatase [Bacillota bacterium]
MFSWIAPAAAAVGLIVAFLLAGWISRQDEGTDRMKEIAGYIREGAMAFLKREYRTMVIVIVVLFLAIGILLHSWVTAVLYVLGALLSVLAGYFGMSVATKGNVRTAAGAMSSGMPKALSIAFRSGAVMGLCVSGLGLLGVGTVFVILLTSSGLATFTECITGFGLGASSMALFGRVGGGIYTKAADVGADLVGKVEAGIPEDDPRNPAVIADNVGDNVGDVAGMGSDLFESYVGSIISAVTLASAAAAAAGGAFDQTTAALFPLILA